MTDHTQGRIQFASAGAVPPQFLNRESTGACECKLLSPRTDSGD